MLSQNMMWSIGLVVLAAVFAILEFLIPSAGLLGIGAVMAAVAALVLAFTESTAAGLTMSGVLVVATPVLFVAAVRIWPYTPIGRRILNLPPLDTRDDDLLAGDSGNDHHGVERRQTRGLWEPENRYRQLIGKVGIAKTNMLPAGLIELEGRKYDAVAQGTAVDSGDFVEVVNVDAGKIRVRITTRRPADQISAVAPDKDSSESSSPYDDDAFTSRTLDELDLDDLGDPLK